MKITTQEERQAHSTATASGGINGALLGTAVSLGIWAIAPRKYPAIKTLPWSIKTAITIIPPVFASVVNAELASMDFDTQMYSSEYNQRKMIQEHRRWNKLSFMDKSVEVLSDNKYKIITGLWALSMWGSWVYVDRDPILTKTQKFVTARMYAQFITVGLLLGSIGLSVYEENHALNHKEKREDVYLKNAIKQGEEELAEHQTHLDQPLKP